MMPALSRLRRKLMSRYAQLLLEFSRQSRPKAFAQIANPEAFFAEAAKEIEADIEARRRELLGAHRPGESADQYQIRSSQASATAEELVLSDHWLLQPEPMPEEDLSNDEDPAIASYYRDLEVISSVVNDQDW
jgi:hypothetical protein